MTTKPTWEMDAGELREYLAERYGAALLHGSTGDAYFRGIKMVQALARRVGLTFEEVLADIRADAEMRLA